MVDVPGVHVEKPSDELSLFILTKMYEAAADGIQLQCGREYGFAAANQNLRTSDISSMTETQFQGLPTNNLSAERNLAIFDKRAAKASKSRNKKFTEVSLRNDLCLYKANPSNVYAKSRKITNLLLDQEARWNAKQKSKLKSRIELKMVKKRNTMDHTKRLLTDFKTWHGPCTAAEELLEVLKRRPSQAEFIVKTEMAYYAHTHKVDKMQRPELYRQNGICHSEKLENLLILLEGSSTEVATATIANLPSNSEALKSLSNSPSAEASFPISRSFQYQKYYWYKCFECELHQLCVVVWLNYVLLFG